MGWAFQAWGLHRIEVVMKNPAWIDVNLLVDMFPLVSTCFHLFPLDSTWFHLFPLVSTWFHLIPLDHTWHSNPYDSTKKKSSLDSQQGVLQTPVRLGGKLGMQNDGKKTCSYNWSITGWSNPDSMWFGSSPSKNGDLGTKRRPAAYNLRGYTVVGRILLLCTIVAWLVPNTVYNSYDRVHMCNYNSYVAISCYIHVATREL